MLTLKYLPKLCIKYNGFKYQSAISDGSKGTKGKHNPIISLNLIKPCKHSSLILDIKI